MSSSFESHAIARPADWPVAPPAPSGSAAAEPAGGLGPGELWRVVKQRKLTVVIAFFVLYAIVGGLTGATYLWWPAYPSEAYLELSPPRQDAMSIEEVLVNPDIMTQRLETEARKLKQLSLLQTVLAKPEIKQTYFYRWYEDDVPKCLYDLQEMLGAAPVPQTQLIRVRLACRYAEEARLIVNTIVDAFHAMYGQDEHDSLFQKREVLKGTLTGLNQTLEEKRSELTRFRERANVPALEASREVVTKNISFLTNQIDQLEGEAADFDAQLKATQGVDPRDLPVTPEMRLLIDTDPILRYTRERVETLEIEIQAAEQAGLMGANHRNRQILDARREGYRAKEIARREELIESLRSRQLDALRQNLARIRSIQTQYEDRLAETEAKERDLDRNIQQFQQMKDAYDRIQKSVETVEAAVRDADHALGDRSRIRLRIVQRAEEAREPSRPDFVLYLGGGALVALLGALGLAFLREFTDKAIRTPIDVARHGHLSVLGVVPLLDDEQVDVDEIELATRDAPHSLVAEAFRQMRTNLLFSAPVESQRSILVTSPSPEDGKTAIAINLAVTLAHSNHRVLLVDCNFRRPVIRARFANTRPEGLSNVLIGQCDWGQVVTRTELPNLDVLTSGPLPPTPAELLGGPYMRKLIEETTQKYDRVIFDGPPVLLISDALVVSKQVDGVILVTRAVANSKGALRRAREQLEKINARVFGAILNGVQVRSGGYYKQQYRDYYDYVSDETIPAALPGVESSPDVGHPPGDDEAGQ